MPKESISDMHIVIMIQIMFLVIFNKADGKIVIVEVIWFSLDNGQGD
jgi:hypothetical protein